MRTNIVIKDELLEEAMKLAGVKTKKEVVNMALEEFVKNRKRNSIPLPASTKTQKVKT